MPGAGRRSGSASRAKYEPHRRQTAVAARASSVRFGLPSGGAGFASRYAATCWYIGVAGGSMIAAGRMLPLLSRLSVRYKLEPLSPQVFFHICTHFTATRGFRFLRRSSRKIVSNAAPKLSFGISHLTYPSAYAPFTPNNSD